MLGEIYGFLNHFFHPIHISPGIDLICPGRSECFSPPGLRSGLTMTRRCGLKQGITTNA